MLSAYISNLGLIALFAVMLNSDSSTAHEGHHHHHDHDHDSTIVNTPSGSLKGSFLQTWTNKKFYSFRGVPFAEPPVGNLRFKVLTRTFVFLVILFCVIGDIISYYDAQYAAFLVI